MQGLAHRTGAGEQLGGHGLDLLAQPGLVQVQAEYILPGVELLQAAHVLGALPDLQGGYDGLKLLQQGVGGARRASRRHSRP